MFLFWSPVLDSASPRANDLLSSVPELVHPCHGAPISLSVDAFDTHLGAVLQQLLAGFLSQVGVLLQEAV